MAQELQKEQVREAHENNRSRQELEAAQDEADKRFSQMKAAEEKLLAAARQNASLLSAELRSTSAQLEAAQSSQKQLVEQVHSAEHKLASEKDTRTSLDSKL